MKNFTLVPILGLKTDVLPDDDSMLQMVSQTTALSHAAGGENFDLKRKKNACTKSFGSLARSTAANASKTYCMGMYELYDGTNRTHLYMDKGVVYYLDAAWEFVALPDTYLHFDAQVGTFTAGNTIYQNLVGGTVASADIVFVYDAGTTGTLFLENVSGTFVNDRIIYESAVGATIWTADGAFASGTGAWSAIPNNTIANVSTSLQITFVDQAQGATVQLQDAADLTADLSVATIYTLKCVSKVNAGAVTLEIREADETVLAKTNVAETTSTAKMLAFAATHASTNEFTMAGMGTAEIGYIDTITLGTTTNCAYANGTVSTTTFAKDNADLYSIIRVGSYMVFADRAETTPMKWKYGDGTLSTLVASGTQYKFRYLTSFQRRVIGLYSDQTNGNIDVRWSSAWPATAITSLSIPAANQLYIPNDDPITGVGLMGRDKCFIFCENSIQQFVYYPDYSTPFRCYTVVPDVGAENHHSIVAANGRLYFFNRSYGFCEYIGGNTVNPISDDIIEEFDNINSAYYPLILGKHIAREKKIKWTMPLSGTSACDHIVSYNYDTGQWEIEDKVARWLDEWLLYTTQTWTILDAALDTWTGGGTTRWSDYTAAGRETVLGHTDGYFYGILGESAASGDMDGYREEPILHFGNKRSYKNLLEVWFGIGETRAKSIEV